MSSTDIATTPGSSSTSCPICVLLVNWTRSSKTAHIISTFLSFSNDASEFSASENGELIRPAGSESESTSNSKTGEFSSNSGSGSGDFLTSGSKNGGSVDSDVDGYLVSPAAKLPQRCSVCLGIFEQSFSQRTIDEIIKKFNEANYDSDLFNLAITLPPSCFLREKVARIRKESEKALADSQEEPLDVPLFTLSLKDACRICYQAAIEQRLASKKIIYDGQSDFTIAVTFENTKADQCCSFLQRWFPNRFSSFNGKKRRWGDRGTNKDGNNSEWSRSAILDVLPSLKPEMAKEFDASYPLQNTVDECSILIGLSRTPLFIGGRYCKYSRYLSQTPWVVDGVRRGNSSVQELMCDHLTKAVGAEDVKFTSSGREDTDVRMLGNGRPFAIQLSNCRRKRTLTQDEIDSFQRQINASTKDISVSQLRVVSDQEFTSLKLGEEHKKKTYVALVCSPISLSGEAERKRILDLPSLGPIELDQTTPIRVLHRRPLAVRRRTVENFSVTIVDEHRFLLRMTTQAGTYVKEFVHGDFGRTRPSLSDLLGGIPVDILELDVENIDLDWP